MQNVSQKSIAVYRERDRWHGPLLSNPDIAVTNADQCWFTGDSGIFRSHECNSSGYNIELKRHATSLGFRAQDLSQTGGASMDRSA